MKTIFTLSAALFSTFCLSAQITITRSDFGQIGDLLYYGNDTTPGANFSLGASGADVTWNFSGSVAANYYDSISFEDPRTFPGSPEESNIALVEGGEATFFNITDDNVSIIIPTEEFGIANPSMLITNLPLSYGGPELLDSSFSQIEGTPDDFGFSGAPFDSMRVMIDVHTRSLVDGWGSLITPAETIDALRVKNETNFDVTVQGKLPVVGTWIDIPVGDVSRKQTMYGWYAKNKKFSVAEAELDSAGNVTRFRYIVPAIPAPTGLESISKTITSVLQPNPVNDVLKVTFNSKFEEKGTLMVFDITGKILMSQEILITKNENEITLKTSELNNGIYFTRIVSEHVNTTSKFVVKH